MHFFSFFEKNAAAAAPPWTSLIYTRQKTLEEIETLL
jgi:hypothetical protein